MKRIRDDEKVIAEIEERKRIKELFENGIRIPKINETTITFQEISELIAELPDFPFESERSSERKLSRRLYWGYLWKIIGL